MMRSGATTTLGDLQRATPRVWLNCEKSSHHSNRAPRRLVLLIRLLLVQQHQRTGRFQPGKPRVG